jgi:hypothetical protein
VGGFARGFDWICSRHLVRSDPVRAGTNCKDSDRRRPDAARAVAEPNDLLAVARRAIELGVGRFAARLA